MVMKKGFIILALACIGINVASAQTQMRSAYFLDGYNFRHQMNPAFAGARSYFSLPALGYTNIGISSNLGIDTFLYPTADGGLTTFMNRSVDSRTFLGKLDKNNYLSTDVSTSVFSIGAWGKRNGFTTVECNVKANVSLNLPYDLFSFMKTIGEQQHYDISNLGVRARTYMEWSLGHTQRVSDRLSVGGKVKILLGLASADVRIKSLSADMNAEKWSIKAQGDARVSAGNYLKFPTNAETGVTDAPAAGINYDAVDFDFENIFHNSGIGGFIGGYGVAFDLGASFEIIRGLTVSAAVLDLGFINWKASTFATTGTNTWEFTGFEDVTLDSESENSIGNQFSHLADGMEDLIQLQKEGVPHKFNEMLAATLNVGLEYKMPFWEGLSVGALSSTRIQGPYTWTEGRFSVNVAVGNWLSASGSYGISKFGSTFGAVLNLHCRALNFFLGTDSLVCHYAPVAGVGSMTVNVPYRKLNVGLNFGLSFNVSKRKDKIFR